jgi:hypothetical protein
VRRGDRQADSLQKHTTPLSHALARRGATMFLGRKADDGCVGSSAEHGRWVGMSRRRLYKILYRSRWVGEERCLERDGWLGSANIMLMGPTQG